MAYDSTVPTTGHTPAQDYATIQGNFAQLAASYNTDHVALNGGVPVGFHKQVSLSDFGAAPFSVSGNQSYIYSANASNAGNQLTFQPSVVNFGLPISPKAMFRVTYNGVSWALGSGTAFNFLSVTGTSPQSPQLNFAQVLADSNYFVNALYEKSGGGTSPGILSIQSKTTGGFVVGLLLGAIGAVLAANDSITVMVY